RAPRTEPCARRCPTERARREPSQPTLPRRGRGVLARLGSVGLTQTQQLLHPINPVPGHLACPLELLIAQAAQKLAGAEHELVAGREQGRSILLQLPFVGVVLRVDLVG